MGVMLYCPKCGASVNEEMSFCPKCGASLKGATSTSEARPTPYWRDEKSEKGEKYEKREKREKHEYAFIGPLIAGLILIFVGFSTYLQVTGAFHAEVLSALFFVFIGVIVIVLGIYAAVMAARRHPRT
jgi:hypothetical protein